MMLAKFLAIGLILLAGCKHYTCIHTHPEQFVDQPPGIVVGGTKYGGGVSVPMGPGHVYTEQVCDQWKVGQ